MRRLLLVALWLAGCPTCARAWLETVPKQQGQQLRDGSSLATKRAQPRGGGRAPAAWSAEEQPGSGAAGGLAGRLGAAAAVLSAAGALLRLRSQATRRRQCRGWGRGRARSRGVSLLASSSEALGAATAEEGAGLELDLEEVEVVDVDVAASPGLERRRLLQATGAVGLGSGSMALSAAAEVDPAWVLYDLNTGETLYDVDFDSKDPNHGFVVGARGLFYETKDGGRRWVSRSFANLSKGEDVSYRFQAVSVDGDDVWILGKPPLLLHSKDSGKSWKKVPVSRKLPGEPKVLVALGEGKAEMATSSGAVYVTENDGKNWKALVNETVDATLNRVSSSGVSGASYFTGSVKSIKRAPSGKYLAVAQRGNFYLTYNPGDERWLPHNRISARRIQAMGFRDASDGEPWDGVWMSLNGGSLTQATQKGYDELGVETKDLFNYSEIRTGGIGIIDIAFRTPQEAWAVGGSGVIYVSNDGGKNWQFDASAVDLPCNLYNVKFFDGGKIGYMIGSGGILLRKVFAT